MSNKDIISSWIKDYINGNSHARLMCEGIKDKFYGTIPDIEEIENNEQLIELPISEAASIGMAIGASQFGIKPIICFQRIEFGILALDQLITNGSKIGYLTAGEYPCSVLLRMVIGRGWGQGPLHSQSFENIWNSIPGLKVFMPASAKDYLECFEYFEKNSGVVISLEHRWTHLAKQETFRSSKSSNQRKPLITMYTYSFNSAIAAKVKNNLNKYNIDIDCIHENSFLANYNELRGSINRTKNLLTIDVGSTRLGLGSEIIAKLMEDSLVEKDFSCMRLGTPWEAAPAQPELTRKFFPDELQVYNALKNLLPNEYAQTLDLVISEVQSTCTSLCDVPDQSFTGPF